MAEVGGEPGAAACPLSQEAQPLQAQGSRPGRRSVKSPPGSALPCGPYND